MKRLVACAVILGLAATAWAQDWAKDNLEKSPRHQEWVDVKAGERVIKCFVVYPEASKPTPAMIVIHEIFGLTDWACSMADQLAAGGYIAIAPDLLSGKAPGGGRTPNFARGGVGPAIGALTVDEKKAALNAVADYVLKLPSCNGQLSVCGFCWGGAESFRYATQRPDLKAAYVFYGALGSSEMTSATLSNVKCPVYGFYGGNDNRIGATIPGTVDLMKSLGKTYEPVTYEGAGHGFMRGGEDPQGREGDKKGREEAWKRWKELLAKE
jgi:carboxymethylenebutenolidase